MRQTNCDPDDESIKTNLILFFTFDNAFFSSATIFILCSSDLMTSRDRNTTNLSILYLR